jgi:protein-S-isoprenylcysteine O-methyltransferase Ste14
MASWSKIARRIRVPLGFAFAALFLWLARPSWKSIAIGAIFIVSGLAIRALASGHVEKNERLATTGPYAHTRNPLYLGSLILAIGFAIASLNLWVGVGLVVMLLAIYLPVIRSEEQFLREHFPEFEQYTQDVPRLWPRLTPASRVRGEFSSQLYWKHREYNAVLGVLALLAVLAAKLIWFSR